MKDKVTELYKTTNKPKTIGDRFYEDLERKIRNRKKKEEMLMKLKRESR